MRFVLAAAIAQVPTIAAADWQWSRWGMTTKELADADLSGGIGSQEGYRHTAEAIEFEVRFRFASPSSGLTSVVLRPLDPVHCTTVLDILQATYGEGKRWRDEANGDLIEFDQLAVDWCIVTNSPSPAPDAAGGL